MAAVRQSGIALQYASNECRSDRGLVLTAVKNYGASLEYASTEFRADREFVEHALRDSCGRALQFASTELRADRQLVMKAVSAPCGCTLCGDGMQQFFGVILIVGLFMPSLWKNHSPLQHASTLLRADKEVVSRAIRQDKSALEFASDELRSDPEILAMHEKDRAPALLRCMFPWPLE